MTRNVATYDLLSQAVHAVSNKRAPYVQDPCTAMLPQQPDQRSPRLRCLISKQSENERTRDHRKT